MRTEPDSKLETMAQMLDTYSNMVYRMAFVYLNNRADAEDVVQEVFIKLYKSSTVFKEDGHVKAWLLKVTANCCKNMLKSFWRKRILITDSPESYGKPEQNGTGIIRALSELPQKYRDVVYLYYYEDYSTKEIAQLLRRNEATVRTQLSRGRELVKSELTGGLEDAIG